MVNAEAMLPMDCLRVMAGSDARLKLSVEATIAKYMTGGWTDSHDDRGFCATKCVRSGLAFFSISRVRASQRVLKPNGTVLQKAHRR